MVATVGEPGVKNALARARAHSPFLSQQLGRFPAIADTLAVGPMAEAIDQALLAGAGAPTPAAAWRRARGALALALGVADLAGALPLEEVVEQLSDFADRAVGAALAAAFAARGISDTPGFAILALGKHGSRELNYSSDVDLLFLYDPGALPIGPREDAAQAAVRIGRQAIEFLQRRNEEGYIFRVDMRLRPSPEATPIALPVDAAISYYESSALPWERAAFIRARAVAGDAALAAYFLDAVQPFVWRRSLDFGAVAEIQSMTRRIRDHYSHGQALRPGFDLKRGRGGIREIEFFTQIHQLIHGGRAPGLRAAATLDALAGLAGAGHVDGDTAAALADAYRLLRTIEHRLQMVDDRQTHSLPEDAAALDGVARLHGAADGAALIALIAPHVAGVAGAYDALAGDGEPGLPRDGSALEAALAAAGFADPAAGRQRIEGWRSGSARSLRTPAARDAFEAMLPALVEAFGASPDAGAAMNRFDDLVARLPGGVNFYRLLHARPALAAILATVLSHAPALAEQLGRTPQLLDGLIDATALAPVPTVAALGETLAAKLSADYQTTLDAVRHEVNERRFALGVQLVTARADPLDAAAGYARIAEAALGVLADAATADFARAHGKVAGGELVVLALGRLGGAALTHASDLDLVYLFTGTHEARSDGPRPLGATEYFNRLAQRVTAALSVPTAAGALYAVDTRLRPSGADGLLAVSLDSFAAYQRGQAWTWEHMALTRGRPVYGSAEARGALAAVLCDSLARPRRFAAVAADAVRMRADMAAAKPAAGPLDIKQGEGGLVDLEFAVQVLQLTHGVALDPRFDVALAALAAADHAPPSLVEAHKLLTRMLVVLRLVSPRSAMPPPASRPLLAAACGAPDWETLLARHDDARQSISAFWRTVAAQAEE